MRALPYISLLFFVVPALASEDHPDATPSPPSVTYEVWGFKWDGQRYEKQANYSFTTTDIKKAATYADQVNGYAGWSATTNIPEPCVVHTVFHGPTFTNTQPSAFPDKPTYAVWAYTLANGKWVKDEKYSWTTPDPLLGLEYAKKVSAVPGWRATDNCPEPVPAAQRYVDGGTVHGADTTPTTPALERSRLAGGPFICLRRGRSGRPEFKRECPIRHLRQLTKLRHVKQRPRHDQHAKHDQHSKYD